MSNLKEWIGWNWGIPILNGTRTPGYEITTIFECKMQEECASLGSYFFLGVI